MSIPYKPHAYQKRAIKFVVERACAALLLDPGLGKTSTMLAAFKLLKKMGMVERMLVVAPLRPARSVWSGEASKWTDFNDLKLALLHGSKKDEAFDSKADVDIINPEGLRWLFGKLKGKRRKDWPWQMLYIDESTRFKNSNSLRFKLLKPHLNNFARRYGGTGSPAPNGLLDLFGQMYILDMGNALGPYITAYRHAHFDKTGFGGYKWALKEGHEEKIYKRLRPLALRMETTDYLKLPPLIYNNIDVELPEKAMKQYTTMEKLLLAIVEGETITAANIAAAAIKCRQIANGGLYRDNDKGWRNLHEAKSEAALELVEELNGKPALIAYEFRHDLDRLKKVFGRNTPHLGGGVGAKEQARIEAAWNAGDLPVLLAQPQSVAHGLNLQGVGAAVVWHSLTWNLEDYEQFIRRIWRQGQKHRVFVHHLVARGTVDEVILATLRSKDRTQRALLAALKSYARQKRV